MDSPVEGEVVDGTNIRRNPGVFFVTKDMSDVLPLGKFKGEKDI